MASKPTLDPDAVLAAVTRLVGAIYYSERIQWAVDMVNPPAARAISDAGADVARAEIALTDLLSGEDYDRRARVGSELRTARTEARERAEAAAGELRAEVGR
jgi:hypothetical protein